MLLVAAIALSSTAAAQVQSTEVTAPCQVVSRVGNVVPVNLLASSKRYSFEKINTECCGPYSQCKCPEFKGAD